MGRPGFLPHFPHSPTSRVYVLDEHRYPQQNPLSVIVD
jgi:hypothetical protein